MSLHRTQHSVRIPRFFAFLGCLALLPLASSAQDSISGAGSGTTNGQVIVFVREATGEPLKNQAVVRLFQSNGTPRGYASTSSGGETVFSNLPLGDYYVEVTAAGYRTARGEAGLPIPVPTQVHIYLQPEPTREGDAAPPGSPILAPKARKELDKGLDALRGDDLKEAQKHLEAASQLAPGHPDVLYLLGVLYTRIQDLPRAQSVLEKATQIDPGHARALAALGTVLSNEGKYEAAIPKLEAALKLSSNSWETHWTLARAYYQQRLFSDSSTQAQQALTLSQGKAPEIQLLLAQALAASGQKAKALEELESFLRDHPGHPKVPTAQRWVKQLQEVR